MTTPKHGFRIHDKTTAPEESRATLEKVEQGYGFIPNLIGVAAESPAAVEAYATLNQLFMQKTSLTPQEQQVVILTISAHNNCGYCVAAHTGSAERSGVDASVVEAIRDGRDLPDAKLDALAKVCRRLIDARGWLDDADVQAFFDAGYGHRQLLDVVAGLALKTISNYTNHIAETPLDTPLQAKAWKKAS